MDAREFEPFGLSHWVAMSATAVAATVLVRYMRSNATDANKHKVCVTLAVALLTAVTSDIVLTWFRYVKESTDLAAQLVIESALPFYLCDVVSIILALALITKSQRLTEIGYLWGVAGTVQGLITPTLYFDWNTPEYYAFFIQHGGVPVAALTLILGLKIVPAKGTFKRALFWSWGYIAIVFSLNLALTAIFGEKLGVFANYGFLNAKPDVGTLFDHMGPWPWYLITLQVVAFSLYALLLLPFRKSQPPL